VGTQSVGENRVCIISLTEVFDEPRVRRQAYTFDKLGWAVTLVGLRGRSELPENWRFIELNPQRAFEAVRKPYHLPLCRLFPQVAENNYWKQPANGYISEALTSLECNLVIAHDYFTAPIAARAAQKCGASFVVDCHEYARGQYHQTNWKDALIWRYFERPYIDALQRRYLRKADAVSTVCDGIAGLLQEDYRLVERPVVVRSIPLYQKLPFRPCGETINVLYHGLVVPTRGMENAIISVQDWRPEFHLTIRGTGNEEYFSFLKRLAQDCGVGERVHFVPPVPFTEMIGRAAEADVGYVVLENFSPQRTFTLPNKFFEYIMAGLALLCSDLPELSRVAHEHDIGVLVKTTDPSDIADRVNSLTRKTIDEQKVRSLEAARKLCWEFESERMLEAYLGKDEKSSGRRGEGGTG